MGGLVARIRNSSSERNNNNSAFPSHTSKPWRRARIGHLGEKRKRTKSNSIANLLHELKSTTNLREQTR